MRSILARSLVGLCLLVVAAPAVGGTKLLRFPDIHGDRVAFAYAGDVWTAPAAGGTARRLTAHPGQELFAKVSNSTASACGIIAGSPQKSQVPGGLLP